MAILEQSAITKFGMKKNVNGVYIRHDVIFSENDFGKSSDANELKLEN